jgi:hypothetical protein
MLLRGKMSCFDHMLLLQDERAAHEAVRQLRESRPIDADELGWLEKRADDVSFKLKNHLDTCPECKRATQSSGIGK